MLSEEIEKRLTSILALGCLAITLVITDRISADPVNVGKMLVLSLTAGCCLPILIHARTRILQDSKFMFALLSGFLLTAGVSILVSKSPWEKGFFGTFGRNTGLLTYFGLSVLFLSATLLRRNESYVRVIRILIVAGILNLVYCVFSINGRDIFTWQNPYGKTLGTFGNPNFISSFMGIFITALFAIAFIEKIKIIHRAAIAILIGGSFYVIYSSGSQQGGVVAVGGIAIVIFFVIRSRFNNQIFSISYLIALALVGFVAIFGMLQRGPLAGVLYKQSVSLRGEYWQAGINMGGSNPFFGVGLDSYGVFYRAYRNASATVVPGIDTISDAAHNIFLDVFASTGFLGLFFYLALAGYILREVILFIKRSAKFDSIFVLLFSCWLAYQAQAVISINQIGIAVWGWVLGGLLLGYVNMAKIEQSNLQSTTFKDVLRIQKKVLNREVPASMALGIFFGGVLLFSAALPSFYADAKLRQAISVGSAEKLYLAAKQFPLDSNRINYLASKISQGGINEQSVELIRIGLDKFPEDYGLLYSQFQISIPESDEQKAIGKRLHSADPYNPAYFEFK
jgi:O-antigen ligase